MKKKILIIIFAILVIIAPAKSVEMKEKLAQVGMHLAIKKDDNAEITKFFEKQQRYANKKNEKKIRAMFAPDFIDNDGLTLDDFMKGVTEVWDLYKNLDYKTTVDAISINGDYATVETTDILQGITKRPYDAKIEGSGIFKAESKSYNYLKKVNGEWVMTTSSVISEVTSLSYGSARNMNINLIAPDSVIANTQYDVKLNVEVPYKAGVIASIVSEPVRYPQQAPDLSQDIFRAVKPDGELERVMIANDLGLNEDVLGCISVAKAVMDRETKQIDIVIDGVAFISKRVNVVSQRKTDNGKKK